MTGFSEMEKGPTISIVIPARNEARCIDRCLGAIRNVKTLDAEIEIVVVDNNSTDSTAAISKKFGATVVTKKEGTIGSLRNAGAAVSRGQFIAFLDADCIVPADWIEKALVFLANDRRTVVGFRMTIPSDANWVAQCWDSLFSKRDITAEVEWLPSGNMIMARDAFLLIGGFDENLETNEDCDFCFRLRKLGFRMLSCADTSVVHLRPPHTLGQVFRKELWHGKEVFRVFVGDVVRSKNFNILRRKNSKIVLYALCNLAFILAFLISLVVAFSMKILLPLGIALALPFITSFVLAWNYTRALKNRKMVVQLTVLLVVYGLSRAMSILPYEKVAKIVIKA
ncbi:putative Glycosyl transferase family 2 [Candidatus Sulfobium mesophilum]|uniref:Putative Glycosyl transferase family 2 n=1 Tax=Candidatus Sulfobium mesophilum TaxID=2016548 RepID=A0A2U3QDW8_9BACT|nr:putative Glycosyl transferase family 2 [Candidatus Sulfobium mesophilum]